MKIGLVVEELSSLFFLDNFSVKPLVKPFITLKYMSIFPKLFLWLKSIRVVISFMIFTCLVTCFVTFFGGQWMVTWKDIMKKKP